MLHGPIQENPAAATLLTLGRQQVTGTVAYAGRELSLSRGDCIALGPTPTESPIHTFLAQSLRFSEERLQAALQTAENTDNDSALERRLIAILLDDPAVDGAKLRGLLRALYTERLAQSFRQPTGLPELLMPDPNRGAAELVRFQLLPLVLDSLGRAAAIGDAQLISRDLEARLSWLDSPLAEAAQHWAAIGPLSDNPTISAVLLRRPAAAPTIAAIVRAGLASLQSSLDRADHVKTLPPPPPLLTGEEVSNEPPPSALAAPRLPTSPEPQQAAPFALHAAPTLPDRDPNFNDPLRLLEAEIVRREANAGSGPELAELWLSLALLWEERLYSPTEAARALREAVAVHPYNCALLQRTALACCRAGDHEIALDYAQAAVMAASSPRDYIAAERTRATLLLRQLRHHEAIHALQNAAATHDAPSEVIVQLAQLMAASDHPDAATALVRAAQALQHQPILAAGLWAEATLRTQHVGITVQGLAGALSLGGYTRAAVAVLWDTAELGVSGSARLPLLNQAVYLAQRSGQAMMATLLLLRAFDLTPLDGAIEIAISNTLGLCGLELAEQIAIAQDVARLSGPERRAGCLRLAGALALQEPSERAIGRTLLRRAVAAGDDSAQTATLLGDTEPLDDRTPEARCQQLQAQLAGEGDRERLISIYAELCSLQHLRGDLRATASAAMRCLALEPRHPIASARLLRAASQLGDPTILDEALQYAVQNAPSATRRAHHHTLRGQLACARGAGNEALDHALLALQCDPHHAGALFLLLRCQDSASAETLHQALTAGERALPDLPTVLYLRIQVAAETQNHESQGDLLERWARTAPLDPRPRYQKLQLSLARGAIDPIVADARALLPLSCSQAHLELIYEACQRTAAGGELRDAAQTLLETMDHAGNRDQERAEDALEYARLSTDPELVTRALERHYIAHQGPERVRSLWHLTAHYRHHLDHLGELRTQLRVLSEAGLYTDVVERLLLLFAKGGDHERLQAILRLSLDHEEDSSRRERLWFLLAAAHQELGDNLDEAQKAISSWLHEQPPTEQRLQTAVGLLLGLSPDRAAGIRASVGLLVGLEDDVGEVLALRLIQTAQHFGQQALALELCARLVPRYPRCSELLHLAEEITLAQRDRDTALSLYRALDRSGSGQHAAQALGYRAARWLELAGEPELALDELISTLTRYPSTGALLDAVERLAGELKRPDVLLDAYLALARSGDPSLQEQFSPQATQLAKALARPNSTPASEDQPQDPQVR